jgi:DNA-binding LytR/AlgR family response regulator
MTIHPVLESSFLRIAGIIGVLLAMSLFWMLLVCYGDTYSFWALAESVTYVGLLSLAGFLYWYLYNYLLTFYLQLVFAVLVQAAALAVISVYLSAFSPDLLSGLSANIPLYLTFGLLCWLSLALWYHSLWQSELSELEEPEVPPLSETEEPHEIIDRISVKEGARIHIIQREELFCIRACGDYVMLVTAEGEFVKEQTMKYFEVHLPDTFARIHRSCIVNTNRVTRIELFGKDKYNVWLKNGEKLRASIGGYKLLKERLGL